jgi:hypothetical protein
MHDELTRTHTALDDGGAGFRVVRVLGIPGPYQWSQRVERRLGFQRCGERAPSGRRPALSPVSEGSGEHSGQHLDVDLFDGMRRFGQHGQ